MFRALLYAYVLGGLTFIPLIIGLVIFITIYTSVPVGDSDLAKEERKRLEKTGIQEEEEGETANDGSAAQSQVDTNDLPTTRKGWLTMRRTFEEEEDNTSYVTLVRTFLDSKSKDPKRSRPKDMWFVVVKRNILYLYEDEAMTECGAVIELGGHEVVIYPEGLADAELFAKRNAICIRQKASQSTNLPSVTKEMKLGDEIKARLERVGSLKLRKDKERAALAEAEKLRDAARDQAFDPSTSWFIFCSSNVDMEDWYLSLVHASTQPTQTPTLLPLRPVFDPNDMNHLVSTLDDQPDVIPMRWLNALIGRIFFSHYRTHNLEAYIIGRLMKKIEKVKRPQFLTSIAVTEVSVGNRPPMLSKPMLKELSKEGDASLEVHFQYKGEVRITVEATAVINLGARFKSYTVKLVLAVVLKELEGNLLVKVKRPPSNRIWYAFTQTPRMVLEVEPIVSDRQITWGMILSTIESQIKQVIQESVVMPNMDDISYFDSLPYEHRGGIWADASRQSHAVPVETAASEAMESDPSVGSGFISKTSSGSAPAATSSHSEEDTQTPATFSQDKPIPDVVVEDPLDSRLKTWFSSVRSDDGKSTSAPDLLVPTLSEDNTSGSERGRQSDVGDESGRNRSLSRPRSVHSVKSNKSTSGDLDDIPSDGHSLRRSISRHFTRDKDDSSSNEGSSGPSHVRSGSTSTRRSSIGSQLIRPSSPPSFFSTLKARAGEKDAISKTAKEAMRKWGVNVNWGSKKDGASGSGSEDVSETTPNPSLLSAGKDGSQGHKQRASYAEVRAAVAERKEKENQDRSRPPSPLTVPVARSNTASTSASSAATSTDPAHDIASNSSMVAASARLPTPHLNSKKSLPSISQVNTDEPVIHDTPIKVQPQAKVMAIPGIHAKHRGEIQSLGNVPERKPAPPPVTSSLTTTIESTLKAPAMQTVYRFWRSPSISNSTSTANSEAPSQDNQVEAATPADASSSASSTQHVKAEQDGKEASNSQLTPQSLGRPTPPALPPRPNAGQKDDSASSTNTTSDSGSPSSSPPVHSDNLSSSPHSSPASAALQSIASKHDLNLPSQAQEQMDSSYGSSVTNGDVRERDSSSAKVVEQQDHQPSQTPVPPRGTLNATPRSQTEGTDETSGKARISTSSVALSPVSSPPPLPPRSRPVETAAN